MTIRSKAQSDVDALQDELVLLDTNNRAFRAAVRKAAIQANWNGERWRCELCNWSWPIQSAETHDEKCPLWQRTYDPLISDLKGKRAT